MTTIAPREALGNAIRYWERGRIIYNVVLAIVLGYFAANWPGSVSRIGMDLGQGTFLLAVSSCAEIWRRPFCSSSGSRVRDCSWEA